MVFTLQTASQLSDGSSMDVTLQLYADRILVLITQLGKVGHMIQASIPETTPLPPPLASPDEPLPEPPAAIQLTSLFGTAPDEHHQILHSIYASHIATLIWTSPLEKIAPLPRRPVIVGIALRRWKEVDVPRDRYEEERQVFETSMRMLWNVMTRAEPSQN